VNRRIVAGSIAVLALLGAAAVLAQPRVSVDSPSQSFGEVWQGQEVTATFVLTNVGRARLELGDIEATCACTGASIDNKSVAAGDSTRVVVQFDSSILAGIVDKTVTVATNDPLQRELPLTVKGLVRQEFDLPTAVVVKPDGPNLVGHLKVHATAVSRVVSAETSDARVTVSARFSGADATVDVVAPKSLAGSSFLGLVLLKTTSPFMPEIRVPLISSSDK